jgi:ataxin-10
LQSLGLVELLLDMLRQLGPPPKPRHQQQQAVEQAVQQQAVQQQVPTAGHHPPGQQQGQQALPVHATVKQPYHGYRADLVALLSNMLFENTAVQDQVLAVGGVELLLSNCNLDASAPVAREWALWSIRNMCSRNEVVQKYIAELQAVEAVPSTELAQLGKELQLDKMTHKLRLVDRPQQHQVQQDLGNSSK